MRNDSYRVHTICTTSVEYWLILSRADLCKVEQMLPHNSAVASSPCYTAALFVSAICVTILFMYAGVCSLLCLCKVELARSGDHASAIKYYTQVLAHC
jgi:hypothetical protein